MPFQPIGDRTPLGVNMENADEYRRRNRDDLAAGRRPPGGVQLGPGWDAFYGGLMRQDEDAADRGMHSRVDLSGIGNTTSPGIGSMPSPLRSLRRAASQPDDTFDPTDYQVGRAELDRTLHDNAARATAQNYATTDLQRAHDPGIVDYEEQEARKKAAEDQQAKDEIEAASFRRLEPTRALELREKVGGMRETAPYNPALQKAATTAAVGFDKNQAVRDAAIIRSQGHTTDAGIAAMARLTASLGLAPGVSPDEVLRHVDAATGDLGYAPPAAPAGPTGAPVRPPAPVLQPPSPLGALGRAAGGNSQASLKQLPPEWDFNLIIDKFGGDVAKADDWLRLNGYRR